MALSTMTQQRAIVDNVLCGHLSPSTCRLGALASLCHPPRVRPSFPSSFPPRPPSAPFWLVVTSHYSIGGQPRSQWNSFQLFLHSKQFSIPILPTGSFRLHQPSSLSLFSSISMAACCWLVVVCSIVDWRPSKAGIFYFPFLLFNV